MEQSTLTEFYRTRKRPIEGSHAAKRRKVIQTEAEVTVEIQREPECVRITRQRSRTTTTWKPARRTRKPRTKKVSDIAEELSNLKAFLKAGMKEVSPVEVGSEVTSINDNHQSDTASSTEAPSLKETRRRKVQTKHKEKTNETQAPENSDNTEKRDILKVRTARRNQTSKETLTEEKRIVEPTQMKDSVVEKSVEESGEHTTDKTPTSHSPSLMVRAKTPVKTSSSGLKINPWIAEQANKVLLSRGQSALLLSQENATSKTKPRKAGVSEKHLLTKTKAQEGLEKARELIKKMRSQESDASKSRETITFDKSERLHKLIKRPTAARGGSEKSISSPTKAPAHERFHSLAQPPSATTVTLPLPYKYKVLAEMFTCCDTILNLLGQRKENCTFKKLKESVEQMCRKRFDKHHLSQLIFVFPASYDLQNARSNPKSSSYQLMIQFRPIKNSKDNRLTLPTTELLSRKKFFLEMLLVTTKGHHQEFIKSLELPLYIDDDKIIRWHPQFKLDSVPDIGQATLPEAPVVKTFTSAQDVLDKGRGSIAPRVEKALVYAATKSREKSKIDIANSQPKADENISNISKVKNNSALKGVSQDLINKIKQKEAKKLEEALMRNPVLDQKMIMQERLPELCRILKTYFTTEKRATIPLEDATVKLSESYKSSISPGQVLEHLNLLSEIIPEWFSVLTVRKCPFVKINRKTDINSVIKKVTQKELK